MKKLEGRQHRFPWNIAGQGSAGPFSVGETIEERVCPKRDPVREVPPSEISDSGHSGLRLADPPLRRAAGNAIFPDQPKPAILSGRFPI